MIRKLIAAFFAVSLILLLPLTAAAYETSEQNEIARITGAESLSDEYGGDTDISGRAFGAIRDSLERFGSTVMKSVTVLLAVVLLASAFAAYRRTSGSQTLGTACEYASVLAVSGCCFSFLQSVFTYAGESIASLCRYMTALLPVTASLYSLGGRVAAGVAGSSALLTFLAVAGNFMSDFLFPLMQGGFVLSLAAALPGGPDLRSVTNFAKNLLTTLLAFVFSIFGVVMYFQTVIAAASDSYAFRTVRFASGALIPVIGSMIGDAARTVAASAGVIKATVGAAGVAAVLALTLPPIIYTLLYKTGILVCAMVSRALGCERESRLLYDINSILSVLFAALTGISVIFIISVALFIKTGAD